MRGDEHMKKTASILMASAMLCGCSTIDTYNGLHSKNLATLNGAGANADEDFNILVDSVGADATTLHGRVTEWNAAELGFGLAVLAAAAYGGFNTVYDGGNLKDAAFAAASIGSLRSFLTPGERRDAYRSAAASMTCLYEKASVFAGPPPFNGFFKNKFNAAGPAGADLDSLGAQFAEASPSLKLLFNKLAERTSETDITFDPDIRYSAKQAAEISDLRLIQQRVRDRGSRAFFSLLSAGQSEQEIYEERFVLVSTAYLAIIGKLLNSTKFSAPGYESTVEALKKAAGDAAQAEEQAEQTAADFAFAFDGPKAALAATIEEPMKKYAQAKVDLLACKPAD